MGPSLSPWLRDPGARSSFRRDFLEVKTLGSRAIGLVLLILGILGAAYGGFSYTKETHGAKIGPVSIEVKEKEHVNVPLWAGVAVAIVGGVMVLRDSSARA